MKEKQQKKIINPEEMLSEAREELTQCRELFILSTLMLMPEQTSIEDRVFWGNIWLNAASEEEKITRELVVPAKLKTGAYRTVPAVEDGVRANASNFIQAVFGMEPELARELARVIIDPHIELTKEIQKKLGGPEKAAASSAKKAKVGREHSIFTYAHGPTLRRAACQS